MAQRVMIAMAIACNPQLLIADEPTTALDVTVQAQMLDAAAAAAARARHGAAADHARPRASSPRRRSACVVMYAGQEVETGPVPAIFDAPRHPYTQALLAALPEHNVGPRAAADDSRRRARRSTTGRPAACCRRAALRACARCRASAPRAGRRSAARACAATFRSTPQAADAAAGGRSRRRRRARHDAPIRCSKRAR